MFYEKKITDLWKDEMVESLYELSKSHFSKDEIRDFVEKQFQENYSKAEGQWRNIYRFESGVSSIDDILINTAKTKSILAANGTVFYNHHEVESPVYKFLNTSEQLRAHFKKLMLEAVKAGDLREKRAHDASQYKHKERMNSVFGVQTQEGSIIANTDSASAITLQAREMISEMLWSIEKFLMGNLCISNTNELAKYLTSIMKMKFNPDYKKYLDFIPTTEDCLQRFDEMLFEMEDRIEFIHSVAYGQYLNWIKDFDENERIRFYYRDNFYALVQGNKIFSDIFTRMYENPEEFYDPYGIPDSYKPDIDLIWDISKEFVFSGLLTYRRVDKYINRTRRCVLMSDTDSIMICLDETINLIDYITGYRFENKKNLNNRFKIVNMLASILSKVCDIMCYRLAEGCNVPEEERGRFQMKNEFFFLRMVLFTGVKKNYVTLSALQEGKMIPSENAVINTGGKLTSSNLVPEIRDRINDVIRKYILEPISINPIELWKAYLNLEQYIRNEILSGNKKFSLIAKYKGISKGYANPEGNDLLRGVTIWNRLYPEWNIASGESVYKLKTKVHTEEDAERYIIDPIWKEKVLDLVFDKYGNHRREFQGQNYAPYGLSSICINFLEGMPKTIPDWLIPIIDVDNIIEMHLKPLTDLLSSVGLHQTKINSKVSKISTLINF